MRSIYIVFCVFVVLLSADLTQATIIHVPADSSTIQGGINGAQNGDTVLVAPNRYADNIDFLGKAITVMSEQGPEVTIIDGCNAGSVVTFSSGEDSNSIIKGFTLTRGYAEYGGGIYCFGSSPAILNNFLVRNRCAPHRGGPAIYCGYGSNAKICGNLICLSDGAAAIFIHVEDSVQVVDNTVCDNTWGGLSIQGNSYAYVKNNIFFNNAPYGIHASVGGKAFIACNDVFGQEDNYAGDLEDQTGNNGNISCDPMFCNLGPRYPNFGNYLADNSCCVGAGCNLLGNQENIIGALGIGCPKRPVAIPLGDSNGDGTVEVGDIVFSIKYLYKSGSNPKPLVGGDVNCDGNVDVGDIVYLINYLFKAGPPPCER
jgi:parallel beta-helix repeat protein